YVEAGPEGAPPVILLHGLGATSASFLPTLWDLSRDHHVFAVDLPGFGETDNPVRPLHAAFFARWLAALLAPSLAWRRCRTATALVRLLRPEIAVTPLPPMRRIVLTSLRALFAPPE